MTKLNEKEILQKAIELYPEGTRFKWKVDKHTVFTSKGNHRIEYDEYPGLALLEIMVDCVAK